jgi:hypothetical protein
VELQALVETLPNEIEPARVASFAAAALAIRTAKKRKNWSGETPHPQARTLPLPRRVLTFAESVDTLVIFRDRAGSGAPGQRDAV